MKAKTALLTLAALVMLAMPAAAEETAAPAADQFATLDANNDGSLSKEEWTDAEAFAKADANSDGAVSKEEYDVAQAPAKE